MNLNDIPKPVNTDERYQYAMLIRLDALCHMVNSLVEHIAEKEGVATTNNTTKTASTKKTTAKKTTTKKAEVKEETEKKTTTRKRTTKKKASEE